MNSSNIDDEWENYIASKSDDDDYDNYDEDNYVHAENHIAAANNNDSTSNDEYILNKLNNTMTFSSMCTTSAKTHKQKQKQKQQQLDADVTDKDSSYEMDSIDSAPIPTDIYVSTKSKIEYLNSEIDIKKLFWDVQIMPYSTPSDGIIKKQIKFNSLNLEELDLMQDKLKSEIYYEEHIIKSINNPDGRIKFKDIRKLSVGIAKKDIMSCRSKKKSAFYNCFVMILRIKIDKTFREFHVKIFNTGKIELTGMQSEEIHSKVLSMIINIMQTHVSDKIDYMRIEGVRKSDTILINSNFNCGFYINREILYSILKNKYNIDTIYDPCSYPGIQCKFYYNVDKGVDLINQTIVNEVPAPLSESIIESDKPDKPKIVKVSFMIFRTGSVLIVGMCNEEVLTEIYNYIKLLLQKEYSKIVQIMQNQPSATATQPKQLKIRKKLINVSS
jgi:TATA-box binding protein (TBP) (component of TFIID and TFIIIB)